MPTRDATTAETTMRAVVQDVYGDADVLRVDDLDRPTAGRGQVLVEVRAAGVDRGAVHLMTGLPYAVRLAGFGVRRPKPQHRIRGRELAGVVVAVGADVADLHVGDEVFGIAEGTFAQWAVAEADKLAPKPAGLGFEEAAALPMSGLTALQALRDKAEVEAGQHVLVIGASGGVGSFAVQIAKAYGAEVTGVASTGKLDLVRALGADHVIDHTQARIGDAGVRYDVIIDVAGNRSLRELRRSLAPHGTLVIVGGEDGGRFVGGIDRQLRAALLSPFVGQRLRSLLSKESGADLRALSALVDAGSLRPSVDRTFPLDQAIDALRWVEAGRARGKVVVTMA